ncbi:MAG TPA: class I SAM-dependent methyltransferase [Rectinemataceae bacterium]|nr:class I SAM-dependent methyltransferase [Rectinemataceae bacterium]
MDLYAHLATVYDRIFPLNPASLAYIEGLDGRRGQKGRAIDLGSATGSLAIALAELGWEVAGVELSPDLLALSRKRTIHQGAWVEFYQADMRDLGRLFTPTSADLILCLGNTLPHLANFEELGAFLVAARSLLRIGGRIILQLVNFDLAGPGFVFPTLVEVGFRFERSYSGLPDGRIAFDTRLSFDEGQSYKDRTALLPLSPKRLESELLRAGFSIEKRLASWEGTDFDPRSSHYLTIVGLAEPARTDAASL